MLLLDQNWGLALVSGAITVSVAAMLDATMMELPCPNTAQYNGIVDEMYLKNTTTTSCYKCKFWDRFLATDYMWTTLTQPWTVIYLILMVLFMVLARFNFAFKFNIMFKGKKIKEFTNDEESPGTPRSREYDYTFDNAIARDDNKALNISFAGYMIGTGLLTWSSFSDLNPDDEWMNVLYVIVWQIFGIIFLEIARVANDKIVLNELNNKEEIIIRRNIAVGITEFGGYIGAGQIVMGATSGTMASFGVDIASAVLFFVLGHIVFLILDYIMIRLDDFDFNDEIKKGNVAVAVYYALNHMTLGQLIATCIIRTDSLLAFVSWVATGTVVIILLHVVVQKILLPGTNIKNEIWEQQNWGAALVYGAIPLSVAIYVNTFLPNTCENAVWYEASNLYTESYFDGVFDD